MTKQELAKAMMDMGYTTGHGDGVIDLLQELEWQVAEREREECAKVAESYEPTCDSCPRGVATAIRSRGIDGTKIGEVGVLGEKPPVKSYCGGKPNYCTPQVTPQVTPEVRGDVGTPIQNREWVGLEPQEIGQIWANHKEVYGFGIELEQVLKERNT